MNLISKALGAILCGLATSCALADIYAYTDANGVICFSNVPIDEHYELLLSTAETDEADPAPVDPRMLARSATYDAIIENAATANDVEPALLQAVIVVESGFNELAESSRGALGLMQLMPATARKYGVSDAFDPMQNIHAGAKHLKLLMDRYEDDLELTLAAYNAGEDAVERYGRRVPPFNETRRYVPKVLKVYNSLLKMSPRT